MCTSSHGVTNKISYAAEICRGLSSLNYHSSTRSWPLARILSARKTYFVIIIFKKNNTNICFLDCFVCFKKYLTAVCSRRGDFCKWHCLSYSVHNAYEASKINRMFSAKYLLFVAGSLVPLTHGFKTFCFLLSKQAVSRL